MNIKHSLNLGRISLRQGYVFKAYNYYSKAISEAFSSKRVLKKWSKPPWPESSYIVNHEYNFIYCPIPKVASTSLHCIMYLLSNSSKEDEELTKFALSTNHGVAEGVNNYVHKLHQYIHNNLTLENYTRKESQKIINNDHYFKFTVVRDPWKRLTSAYINKFVDITNPNELLPSARTVIEGVYTIQGEKPDYEKSITFRQFLNYVARTKDQYLDVHWKAQIAFLKNINIDYVAKLETLADDFEYIKRRINLQENFTLPKKNVSTYAKEIDYTRNYADLYPIQLKQLEQRPPYQLFYTSDLVDLVQQRYNSDFKEFGYDNLHNTSDIN